MGGGTREIFAEEQTALLKRYYLDNKPRGDEDPLWSSHSDHSISPFVPCASSRIPCVLRACRLTPDDVLWDLGCGDGRLLHQAAAQYGCRTVGVDIDAVCIAEARQRAAEQGVQSRCQFACVDLTALQPGALRPRAGAKLGSVDLGAAQLEEEEGEGAARGALRAPTVLLIFITGHGLSRLSRFLHGEWAAGGLRIVTCVESLATCFDYESENPLFDQGDAAHEWLVYDAHEARGVYVVRLEIASYL